jgi:hypothetical protein
MLRLACLAHRPGHRSSSGSGLWYICYYWDVTGDRKRFLMTPSCAPCLLLSNVMHAHEIGWANLQGPLQCSYHTTSPAGSCCLGYGTIEEEKKTKRTIKRNDPMEDSIRSVTWTWHRPKDGRIVEESTRLWFTPPSELATDLISQSLHKATNGQPSMESLQTKRSLIRSILLRKADTWAKLMYPSHATQHGSVRICCSTRNEIVYYC